jgi:hypothetical protein
MRNTPDESNIGSSSIHVDPPAIDVVVSNQDVLDVLLQTVQSRSNANVFILGVLKLLIMQLCLTTVALRILFYFQHKYAYWRVTANGVVYVVIVCVLLVILYLIYVTQSLRIVANTIVVQKQNNRIRNSLRLFVLFTASTIIPVIVVLCLEILWIDSAIPITTTICLFLLMSTLVWFPLAGTSMSYTTQLGIVVIVHIGNVLYFLWAFGISVFNGFASLAPVQFANLPRLSKQAVLESVLATVLLVGIIINMAQVVRTGNSNGITTHISNIHSVALNLYMESYCLIVRLCSCCCSNLVRCTQAKYNNNSRNV